MIRFLLTNLLIASLFTTNIFAQSACFTYTEFPVGAPHCQGITLIFTGNCSSGGITYSWDFGAGAIPQFSNIQNPGIVNFPVCGTYAVTLNINGGGGALTSIQNIVIYCDPVACFINNPTTACTGVPINFNSGCSQIGQNSSSLSYVWDMGNGQQLNNANPSYVYPVDTAACYTVSLIVTNNQGCTDFFQIPQTVCITDPPDFQISSTIATTCLQNLLVDFCAPPISGGNPGYIYSWTFQGGTPATSLLACPTGIFFTTGQWDVSCVVTDANGCSSNQFNPNFVNVGNGTTAIILSDDTVCIGESVVASTSISNSYLWSINPLLPPFPNDTSQNVTYTFTTPGTYTINLVANINGCIVPATATVNVFPKPVACINITSNPPSCSFPQTVNVVYCGVAGGWTYNWQFPGGTPSSSILQNPGNITYNSCGRFSILLTVTGVAGCDSTIVLTDTVKIDCPVSCYTITNLPVPGHYCAPLSLNFDAGCSTGSPTQYLWCVQPVGGPTCVPTLNLGQTPSLNFANPGCYDVSLKIVNAVGCTSTAMNVFPGGPICVGEHIVPCFTANPLVQCAPLPVNFLNCTVDSLGVPGGTGFPSCLSWCWNFGDGPGCQSSVQEPEHLYQDTGLMDISLVINNCGCNDTLLIVDYVYIAPPIPNLIYSINCDSPNVVLFDGTSSIGADTYTWSFPGNTTWPIGGTPISSTDSILYVTYPMPNPNLSYTAQLIVCNIASGCCDTTQTNFFLRNLVGIVTIDTIVCYPETSFVTNNSTGANTYVWKVYDLCNGGILVNSMTSALRSYNNPGNAGFISWPAPGNYRIVLRQIAYNLCEDTLEWNVTVRGLTPSFFGAPLSGCAPFITTFTDTTLSSCVSNPISHKFSFGDGSSSPTFTPINSIINHTYTANGSFTVTDSVKDQFGCVSVFSAVAYVNAQTPEVNFNVADTTICVGSQVCFNNNSIGLNLNYVWNFGDNTTSIVSFPCHTYASNGTYTVTLSAIDINGCKDTLIKLNYIIVGQVNVDFYVTDSISTCPPLSDTFFITPVIPGGCGKYYWNFGDGAISQIDTPFHIYGYAGIFTVSLTAIDTCLGCSTTVTKINYINLGGPFSNPVASPDTSCVPQLICFDLNPTNSVSFLWDFDDGSPLIAGTSSICHLYADTGVFYPSVVLTDSSFTCTYTRIVDTLVVIQPLADFSSSTNDLCSNGQVTFIDSSYSLGGIVGWLWDFGDFTTSNLQNPPPHNYNTFGDYVVILTITSHGGCTAIAKDTIHVTASPTAIPIIPSLGLCLGIPTQFLCDTSGAICISWQHWDFGNANSTIDTSNICNPTYIYPSASTYPITFIVYGCNGCNDTAFTSVTITGLPTANAGPDVAICNNDTALLIGTGGDALINPFEWGSPLPPTLSTVYNDSVLAFPLVNTIYTLIVTNTAGCKDTDDVVVTITLPPVASISAGDSICPGSSYSLTASGGTTYLWSTGETTTTITVTPNVTTTYTVTAFVGACGDDTSAFVFVLPLPPVDAGDSAEFCLGLTTQLNGFSTASIYLWGPSATLSDSIILNPIASPTVTTTYTLTVTDANGCKNNDTVLITVHPLPVLDSGADRKICSGTCTQLTATGAIYYTWNPTTGLLDSSIPNPISCPTDTIIYYVTGTDVYGCQGTDSIKISVLFPFTVTYSNDTCFCYNNSAVLCANSSTISFYKWRPISGLDSSTVSCVEASPTSNTTYTVYVTDELGCYADTGNIKVCIYPLPIVLAGPDETILVGTTAQLSAYNVTTPGAGTYLWIPDSTLSCNTCINPIANPLQTTIYFVALTDLNGCKDDDTTVINVYCNDNVLFIPNAFTPNGDGLNDEVQLEGVGITQLNFLRIFNRWGQLVFESTNFNDTWDGTFNGRLNEPEVFDYYLEAVCSTGQLIRKQGNITLIR